MVNMPTAAGEVSVAMNAHPGQTVDLKKSQEIMADAQEKAAWERIGRAAEAFNKMHQAYATDYALTPEELSCAVYLENVNMREFFPEDLGGTKGYDALCKAVWNWFSEQKNKPS